jgi:hypothetical protein
MSFLNGSSFGEKLPGKPPFNPHVTSFGWLTPNLCMFIPPWYQPHVVQPISEPATNRPYNKLHYQTYVKDIDPNAHIRIFKKAIKANSETMEVDIINLFGFTLKDNIYEWGENYVQDHSNCTFKELEQAFCKQFKIVKNNEEAYMQQQTTERVEVYYERLLKLTSCLQVKTTYVFLTIIFMTSLLPYLRLSTTCLKRNNFIEHKEVVVCEKIGPVNLSYNVLLITP